MKTTKNDASVRSFLAAVPDEGMRKECAAVAALMAKATGCEAKMWGDVIVGFDTFHYEYSDGKPGSICLIGFSPRKNALVLYGLGPSRAPKELLKKLGKHKVGGSCLHIGKLQDVHLETLDKLIHSAVKSRRQTSKADK